VSLSKLVTAKRGLVAVLPLATNCTPCITGTSARHDLAASSLGGYDACEGESVATAFSGVGSSSMRRSVLLGEQICGPYADVADIFDDEDNDGDKSFVYVGSDDEAPGT
jgi:hypothetical protein